MAEPIYRKARREDVPRIIALLADDVLGAGREQAGGEDVPEAYWQAFAAIDADPNNELIVIERDGALAGCLQITWIPGLSRGGAERCQIESVRVASAERGSGLGRALFEWAIDRARERGCGLVQLTSDKRRADAIRFYESLGFEASHEGLKLAL